MSREKLTHAFLWLSVTSWAIGLGAKIFDLVVIATAWGANPPASLALYPYGRRFPVDPGEFFQPLSAVILIGALGALISGWKARPQYRVWLWTGVAAFILIWIATPTLFWPIINEFYAAANGKIVRSDAVLAELVRRWFLYDWLRVILIAIGFFSSLRAISMPYSRSAPLVAD